MDRGIVSERQFAQRLLLTMCAQGVLAGAVMWGLMRVLNEGKQESYRKKVAGRRLKLTRNEYDLLDCVCEGAEIDEDFSAVGGLERVKDTVYRSVVLPFRHPDLYPASTLRCPPKGLLLHGPPGTGKTLMAKAIAKSCGAAFVEVKVESLFGKWLGQSEQAVAAIFSLARKLQPCIIFVDELDSLLSSRDFSDSHAYNNAKTIFLRQWDGFRTCERDHRVVVVGATNRPEVLDSAVLRRLPVKLRLGLPATREREQILRILLRGEDISHVDLGDIATRTQSYSGSDLRELCKQALLLVVQEEVTRLEAEATAVRGGADTGGAGAGGGAGHVTLACGPAPLGMRHLVGAISAVGAGSGGCHDLVPLASAPAESEDEDAWRSS